MKKLAVFLSIAAFTLILPLTVKAQAFPPQAGDRVVLSADQIVDHDYFAAGEIVEIYGTINGDLYAAGGQVIINGTINGDVLAAGGQLTLDANVSEDARLAGGQITVNGAIAGNLTFMGGNVILSKDLTLAGNLVGGVGNLESQARVSGNITLGAGNATLGNQIGGDITAGVGLLRFSPDTSVDGDLTYYSEEDFILPETATISGDITKKLPPEHFRDLSDQNFTQQVEENLRSFVSLTRLISLLTSIIIGYLLIHFFPNYSYRVITAIEDRPGMSALTGLVTLIVAPILGLILLILVITAPLGLILWLLFGLILYLSRIFFMYWLGARILDRMGRTADKTITLLIGIGLYYILTAIAIIGPLTLIVSTLLGTGAILLAKQRTYLSARKLKIF